jgi:hypothetical protein
MPPWKVLLAAWCRNDRRSAAPGDRRRDQPEDHQQLSRVAPFILGMASIARPRSRGLRPFWNRKVNGGKTETEEADDDRERFDPADVVRLWKAAEAKGDFVLATAIKLAAYTGARREGAFAPRGFRRSRPTRTPRSDSCASRKRPKRVSETFRSILRSRPRLMNSSRAPARMGG